MKAILWKELRENWKWAGLGMLGLACAELLALYQPTHYGELALTTRVFELVTICGSVLIGAALGALQILPELERDRWAALLHRPVSRTTLFLGKIGAGLILYLFAAGVPLLLSLLCFAAPGQFSSPFIPGLVPPVIADAFLGVAFYSLAVLVSLTRGRWYGRRALLVLGALPLLLLIPGSRWLFLPTFLATALLLTAAWGTMAGNGSVRPGLRLAEFSLGLLLCAGVEIVFLIAFLLLHFLPGAEDELPSDYESRQFVVTDDGQVFASVHRGGHGLDSLQQLDGTPVTDEKYVGNESARLTYFLTFCWNLKTSEEYTAEANVGDPHAALNFVQVAYGDNTETAEFWYYLTEKDYLVGYDKETHRRIGICDRDGFHSATATPHPFPKRLRMQSQSFYTPRLGWIDGQLYGLDFSERILRTLFTAPSGPIHAVNGLAISGKVLYSALMLDTSIQILDLQGQPVVNIPYGHDAPLEKEISLAVTPAADRIFVQYVPFVSSAKAAGKKPSPTFIDEVDLQGHVRKSYSTIGQHYERSAGWTKHVALLGTPFAPTGLAALADVFSRRGGNSPGRSLFDSDDAGSYSWSTLLLAGAGVGAMAAAAAARWARQAGFGERETLGWLLFTFSLGLPGLVAFRLAAPFPTRIACPHCTRKRSLQTEECPTCHQAWPAPTRNGTEIFAESECYRGLN